MKVMAGLKKFWQTISTGWVVEYPGKERDGPKDFFDRRSDGPRQSYHLPQEYESHVGPKDEEDEREDGIARWSEQMRARDSRDTRSQ